MNANHLPELAARVTAPMRTTGGRAFLEIVPPTLDLLARGKPASPEAIAAGLSIDTFDDEHPRQTRLVYALDADQEQAWWLSADPTPAPWTNRYVHTERIEADNRFPDSPSLSLSSRYYSGSASVARIEPPDVTVRSSERDGDTRNLELHFTPGEASRLALYADTRSHAVTAATVYGISVETALVQTRSDTPRSGGSFSTRYRLRGST
jgi:hypothetical protein